MEFVLAGPFIDKTIGQNEAEKASFPDKKWDLDETQFLKDNFSELRVKDIAQKLGRTYCSVSHKAAYLCLVKDMGRYITLEKEFVEEAQETSTVNLNASETPIIHIQDFKLLISIPATKTSHLPIQQKALEAIIKATEGYVYDLDVGEANEFGWGFVVAEFNRVAEKVLAENYDYVLIVESDVIIPPNTISHLLSCNTDVAEGVVKFHRYPDNFALDEMYKDAVNVGLFLLVDPNAPNPFNSVGLYMKDVENKILTFKDTPNLMAGTGCNLIKRSVFERGIRWHCNLTYATYDVYFWRDIAQAGLSASVDGFVVCDHLGT